MGTTIESPSLTGNVSLAGATSVTHKAGSVTNADIASAAGVDYDKLDHYELVVCNFDLPVGGTPAAREEVVFVARSAGVLQSFHAGLVNTGTATVSCDFDLNVNGTTALSADVNVDHNDSDRENIAGTISSSALAAGDVVSISLESVTANDSTGPFAVVGISYATPA